MVVNFYYLILWHDHRAEFFRDSNIKLFREMTL